jgi:hypothetical protein
VTAVSRTSRETKDGRNKTKQKKKKKKKKTEENKKQKIRETLVPRRACLH